MNRFVIVVLIVALFVVLGIALVPNLTGTSNYLPAIQHIQEFWVFYVIGTVVIVGSLYAVPKYSGPLYRHISEMALYVFAFHTIVAGIVLFVTWYSSMAFVETDSSRWAGLGGDRGAQEAAAGPEFFTPYLEFWNSELYRPDWLYSFELAGVCIIILAVALFRPLKFSTGPANIPQESRSRRSEPHQRTIPYAQSRTSQYRQQSRRR